MEEEWTIKESGEQYSLYWGDNLTAVFAEGVVVEEMERVVEKLNEGTAFDGRARVVPA